MEFKSYPGFPSDYGSRDAREYAQGMKGWENIRNELARYRSGAGQKPELESLYGMLSGGSVEENSFMKELLKYMLQEKSGRSPYYKADTVGPDIWDDEAAAGATPAGGSRYK